VLEKFTELNIAPPADTVVKNNQLDTETIFAFVIFFPVFSLREEEGREEG
jgi:hypothetical protein